MKIYLLVLILFGTAAVSGQNAPTLISQTGSYVGLTVPTEAQSTPILAFIQTSGSRIGYISQGDTIYFDPVKDGENKSTFAKYIPTVFGGTISQPSSDPWMTIPSATLDAWSKNGTTERPILSGSTPIGQLVNCQTCYTLSNVQPHSITSLTEISSTITQQFEVDSLVAYFSKNPGDGNAWLRAGVSNLPQGSTSLSIWTANNAFPNNRNGTININVGNGTLFGISTDSLTGNIGWINNPQGIITLRAGTLLTAGNFIDSGFISSSAFVISDHPGSTLSLPVGYQGVISSSSPLGAGFMIESNSSYGSANATFTLKDGPFQNSIVTVSANSQNPDRPSGSMIIEAYNRNMILNAIDEKNDQTATIWLELNSSVYARLDDAHGFAIFQRPIRLPNFTTKEMMALTNLEPGDEVFNTDLQTNCTYTGKVWKAQKMYVIR